MHADHLGTPRAITRPADNQLVWKWDNTEPFGNSLPNENPSGLGVFQMNLRHPGQYYDQEVNTFYNYHRDYDPSTGRYRQSDPIGIRDGLNTYAYVGSRPLVGTDPYGLYTCYYSISSGAMECRADNDGNPDFWIPGWSSGKGRCKDQPNCGYEKNEGPTPRLTCYRIGDELAPKKDKPNRFRRNLSPVDPRFVKPRDDLQIHSCGNTVQDGCSIGCIVNTDAVVKIFSTYMNRESKNIVCVSD